MNWKQLLSAKRTKALWGEKSSTMISGDPRSEFDRDFGRAVFSTPVRRLQDKAQVFPLEEHDAVRTRLTHSLEVSSVARSLGEAAERIAMKRGEIENNQVGSIPTIAATCGLIHDLGNPPFGHAGELAISDWFRKQERLDPALFDEFESKDLAVKPMDTQFAKDFLNFEGNAQTLRLIARLQVLADDYGLNLTCGTLSASSKYVARSDTINRSNQARKKHGFFASENELVSRMRQEVGTEDARNPIAFLVEASDDIVYSTVDLEDGIKKHCMGWDLLEEELLKKCGSECLKRSLSKAKEKIEPAGLTGQSRDEAMAIGFRTFAIPEMVAATIRTFDAEYDAIMAGEYAHEILYKSEAGGLAETCKDIARERVYVSSEVLKREIMGREIIFDLLDLYWEAAQAFDSGKDLKGFSKKIYDQISSNYRRIFQGNMLNSGAQGGPPAQYFRMQLITDQVSGMTDSFAVKLHRELKNG
jgi:dGTPase